MRKIFYCDCLRICSEAGNSIEKDPPSSVPHSFPHNYMWIYEGIRRPYLRNDSVRRRRGELLEFKREDFRVGTLDTAAFRTNECGKCSEREPRKLGSCRNWRILQYDRCSFEKRNPRIAIIGTGGRGTNLLENLLAADAQVVALCDVVKAKAEHARVSSLRHRDRRPRSCIQMARMLSKRCYDDRIWT